MQLKKKWWETRNAFYIRVLEERLRYISAQAKAESAELGRWRHAHGIVMSENKHLREKLYGGKADVS